LENWKNPLFLGPKSISGSHIEPSYCTWWVLQSLFGIFRDFNFLGICSLILAQKIEEKCEKVLFLNFRTRKMAENLKISKNPKYRLQNQ
jgi:hypothetical protein